MDAKTPNDRPRRVGLDDIVVTESVYGTFHYHLSKANKRSKGLCGEDTMITGIPLNAWGFKGHLNERYCAECERLCNRKT
jgi:hypothetical protein